MVDNTLFKKKINSHLIIVQIYVDDIIFGSTCQNLCDDIAKIMHEEVEMSMMGELNFFLGIQIKQMEDGIFFNKSKYIKEMLKKFRLEDSKPTKTPMSMEIKLTKDDEADSVDSTKYQDLKSKTTEDIISNRSFMEVLVLNHYVLVKKVLFDDSKEQKNETKGSKSSRVEYYKRWRILEDLVKDMKTKISRQRYKDKD
uniref:Retrovirus-related Pol polyprotein from transposon TNT 1-94 n=1 Tax=Tanacetum cinerariifolium TaxID=118510 RepID=A0A6L2KE31_TANCI|nr:retrovirus-related Pol polyprotein from transposon TNT 1-94 [Tanacetum cinerariifolium]